MNHQRFRRRAFSLVVAAFLLFCQDVVAFMPFSRHYVKRASLRRSTGIGRRMVADTPDAVVEQVSTQTVLDDILDESLRYSARRPIIMEFDPASKAVSVWISEKLVSLAISYNLYLRTK